MDDSGFKSGVILGYLAAIFRGGHQSRASFVKGVTSTYLKNMRKSNWIISPTIRGERNKISKNLFQKIRVHQFIFHLLSSQLFFCVSVSFLASNWSKNTKASETTTLEDSRLEPTAITHEKIPGNDLNQTSGEGHVPAVQLRCTTNGASLRKNN